MSRFDGNTKFYNIDLRSFGQRKWSGARHLVTLETTTASNTDLAGQLTSVSGTKSYTFTGTHVCVASDTAATPVAAQVTTTSSTLTLTVPGGANTDTFNYICIARN